MDESNNENVDNSAEPAKVAKVRVKDPSSKKEKKDKDKEKTRTKPKRTKSSSKSKPSRTKSMGGDDEKKKSKLKKSKSLGGEKKKSSKLKAMKEKKESSEAAPEDGTTTKKPKSKKKLTTDKPSSSKSKRRSSKTKIDLTDLPPESLGSTDTDTTKSPDSSEHHPHVEEDRLEWARMSTSSNKSKVSDKGDEFEEVYLNDSSINDSSNHNERPPPKPERQASRYQIISDCEDEDDNNDNSASSSHNDLHTSLRDLKKAPPTKPLRQESKYDMVLSDDEDDEETEAKELHGEAFNTKLDKHKKDLDAKTTAKIKALENDLRKIKDAVKIEEDLMASQNDQINRWANDKKKAYDDILSEKERREQEYLEEANARETAKQLKKLSKANKKKEAMAAANARIEAKKQELENSEPEASTTPTKQQDDDYDKAMAKWSEEEDHRIHQMTKCNEAQGDQLKQIAQNKAMDEKAIEEATKAQEMAELMEEAKEKEAMVAAKERIESRKQELEQGQAEREQEKAKSSSKAEDDAYDKAMEQWSADEDKRLADWAKHNEAQGDALKEIARERERQQKAAEQAAESQEIAELKKDLQEKEAMAAAKARIDAKKHELEEQQDEKDQAISEKRNSGNDQDDKAMEEWSKQEDKRLDDWWKYNESQGDTLKQIEAEKNRLEQAAKDALKAEETAKYVEEAKEKEAMAAANARIEARRAELAKQQSAKARMCAKRLEEENADEEYDEAMEKWSAEEDERLKVMADYVERQGDFIDKIAEHKAKQEKALEDHMQALEMAKMVQEAKEKEAMAAAKKRCKARKQELARSTHDATDIKGSKRDDTAKTQTLDEEEMELMELSDQETPQTQPVAIQAE